MWSFLLTDGTSYRCQAKVGVLGQSKSVGAKEFLGYHKESALVCPVLYFLTSWDLSNLLNILPKQRDCDYVISSTGLLLCTHEIRSLESHSILL